MTTDHGVNPTNQRGRGPPFTLVSSEPRISPPGCAAPRSSSRKVKAGGTRPFVPGPPGGSRAAIILLQVHCAGPPAAAAHKGIEYGQAAAIAKSVFEKPPSASAPLPPSGTRSQSAATGLTRASSVGEGLTPGQGGQVREKTQVSLGAARGARPTLVLHFLNRHAFIAVNARLRLNYPCGYPGLLSKAAWCVGQEEATE